jgi:hypothetical protein
MRACALALRRASCSHRHRGLHARRTRRTYTATIRPLLSRPRERERSRSERISGLAKAAAVLQRTRSTQPAEGPRHSAHPRRSTLVHAWLVR